MDLQPNVVSAVVAQKEEFADIFTKKLVTASLRNIIDKATPYNEEERAAVLDPKFKTGLDAIANNISTNTVDAYKKSGVVPSGSFFDSMVNCISTHVSMEAESRMEEIFNDIKLGKIDTSRIDWANNSVERFSTYDFKNTDVKRHFKSEFNNIVSVEEASVIQDIKDEVKDSITEAETKSQIVEDTISEVNDIKKEMDPPDEDPATAPATTTPAVEDTPAPTTETTPVAEKETPTDTNESETSDDSSANTTDEVVNEEAPGSDVIGGDAPVEEEKTAETTADSNVAEEETPLKDEKEITAEKTAESFIPILPRKLKTVKMFSVEAMANDFFRSSGNVAKETRIRLDSLKLALTVENLTENNEYLEKYQDIETKTSEALKLSDEISNVFNSIGLTQNGIYKKNIISMEAASNIIGRFINKKITVSISPKEYTSTENILANAFDVVQLKQNIKSGVYGKDTKLFMRELDSRESLFYKNIINVEDKEVKDAANNVMKLQDVRLDKVINPDFIKDYKMTVWESNIGSIKNVNEEVFNRVSKKLEALWGRKLTSDEADIIRATTNNEDATDIVPTEFEKFVIKFGKEEMTTSRESGCSINFTDAKKKKIYLKSKVYATTYKTLEHLGILNKEDTREFDRFINAI